MKGREEKIEHSKKERRKGESEKRRKKEEGKKVVGEREAMKDGRGRERGRQEGRMRK